MMQSRLMPKHLYPVRSSAWGINVYWTMEIVLKAAGFVEG